MAVFGAPTYFDSRGVGGAWGYKALGIAPAEVCERSIARPGRTCRGFEWARQDSNLGPTDYESAALTS